MSGGTVAATAALAGARVDAQSYAGLCDDGGTGPDCAWFKKSGVDLHKVDTAKAARSNLDRRVGAVVAVDPEFAAIFSAASLSSISVPVQIVSLGRPEAARPGMSSAGLEKLVPAARHDALQDATPFDAFSECRPKGAAILRSEGDDGELYEEGENARAEIHERLASIIAAAFDGHLRNGL